MQVILPQAVADYLTGHHVMTLATQGADGPWAAAVFYASDGCSLIFLSSPASRHCRNLALDVRCAATIQEDYRDWPQIKGIQLEGRVGDWSRRNVVMLGCLPITGGVTIMQFCYYQCGLEPCGGDYLRRYCPMIRIRLT